MGWEYLNDGEFNDALFMFQEAANADASNLEAYLGLGYAYARSQEPISAQRNLSNVISLGQVMLESNDLDEALADTLFAESYAGQASVALSTQDFESAVDYAQQAQAYWASFGDPKHRWLPDFTSERVMLLEAQAWYGLGEYGETLMLLDGMEDGLFIPDLIASNHLEELENDTLIVTLLQETELTGVAQLDLEHTNLVYPMSVMTGDIGCSIVDYDVAGDNVQFMGNPIPTLGDEYVVSYYYTDDYGQFLIQIQEKLNE
ncbi:hypothetical protein BMS3Bbin04_02122 [bacterium BMS3Bbin04]|nr:hypothetical protein BMS3Bbin04_02122 [bacterium BMS3Bbin04]